MNKVVSRETDHEVAVILDSRERDDEGGDVDGMLSLFAGPEFNEDEQGNGDLLSNIAQRLVSAEDTGRPITD